MRKTLCVLIPAVVAWLHATAGPANESPESTGLAPSAAWKNGPPTDESWFPLAVWLQNPSNAPRFKAAGINLYVGLWRGPTESQLDQLARAGMPVICGQNATALKFRDNPIIVGWMHGDEPDNAQSLGRDKGYGPPILPEVIVRDYRRMRDADPTRPVLLNLGQGVAWDAWIGRGVRRNHPEDYPEYVKGCDIASFDIYPVVHDHPEVSGRLEFVARGAERLVNWHRAGPVWTCIECTHISNPKAKATPEQIRAEVWMSLIHGSSGLIYFVHEFEPRFKEAGLLEDPEQLAAVTAINKEILELAPVLKSPPVAGGISAVSSDPDVPIAAVMKRHRESRYVFAVSLRNAPARASFTLTGREPDRELEVLDESRRVPVRAGSFSDDFKPYAVHLYRLPATSRASE